MKLFQMNDCDWWIGETISDCIKDCIAEYGCDLDDFDDARELDDLELDSLIFTDDDEDGVRAGEKRTFREQLAIEVAKGGEFPRMFASTEF